MHTVHTPIYQSFDPMGLSSTIHSAIEIMILTLFSVTLYTFIVKHTETLVHSQMSI